MKGTDGVGGSKRGPCPKKPRLPRFGISQGLFTECKGKLPTSESHQPEMTRQVSVQPSHKEIMAGFGVGGMNRRMLELRTVDVCGRGARETSDSVCEFIQ